MVPGWFQCGLWESSRWPSVWLLLPSFTFAGPEGVAYPGHQFLVPLSPPLTISVFNRYLSMEQHSILGVSSADRKCSVTKDQLPTAHMGSVPPVLAYPPPAQTFHPGCWSQQSWHRPGSQPPAVYLPKIFLQLEFNLENVLQIEYLGRIF